MYSSEKCPSFMLISFCWMIIESLSYASVREPFCSGFYLPSSGKKVLFKLSCKDTCLINVLLLTCKPMRVEDWQENKRKVEAIMWWDRASRHLFWSQTCMAVKVTSWQDLSTDRHKNTHTTVFTTASVVVPATIGVSRSTFNTHTHSVKTKAAMLSRLVTNQSINVVSKPQNSPWWYCQGFYLRFDKTAPKPKKILWSCFYRLSCTHSVE